jgi:hypothetical protein
MRRRNRRLPEIEDDGLVGFRTGPEHPEVVQINSVWIMEGFDELPKALRDAINYAPTPELGAKATYQLMASDGPYAPRKSRARADAELLAARLMRDCA